MKQITLSFKSVIIAFALCTSIGASAQLTGTKNIPGDYATLDLAIIDLNLQGVGAGGVTLNVVAGNPQSAPAGGYVITATGTAANTITISGNSNPVVASPALTAGAVNDGIFKILGGDFITIAQFLMQENPANTTTAVATNNMTEWGVALLYASPTDGAQNNTIAGNTISLDRTYSNSFGVYSNVRHSATDVVTLADISNSTTAPNSGNKVWANIISNVNVGVVFIGSGVAANMDQLNDIGGASALTGNSITNFGGQAPGTLYNGLVAGVVLGVYLNDENNFNLSYNTIISASLNTATTLREILTDYAALPVGPVTNNITNNTLTLSQAGTGGYQILTTASTAGSASNVTLNINNNSLINSAITTPAGAVTWFGIVNLGAFGTVNMNTNILRSNSSTSTTAGVVAITCQAAVVNAINIQNNQVGNASGNFITFPQAVTVGSTIIFNNNGAATATLTISGNTIQGLSFVTCGGTLTGIGNSGGNPASINITNNTLGTATGDFVSYSGTQTSAVTGINNTAATNVTSVTIQGNDIRRIVHGATGSGAVTGISSAGTPLNNTISNNTFTNLSLNTTGAVTLISHSYTMPANGVQTISNNSIVTGLAKTAANGNVTCTATNGSSPAGTTAIYLNNNFSNITVSGTSAIIGISNTDGTSGTSTKTMTGNTFNNWTGVTGAMTGILINYLTGSGTAVTGNTITNFNGQGAITGINLGNSLGNATAVSFASNTINTLASTNTGAVTGINSTNASTGITFSGNTIHTLSSTAASTVSGILTSSGTSLSISKNKIYNLSNSNAGGSVNGIAVSGGTSITISNNLVGDLRTTTASATNPLNGLNITGGTTVNVYYNTVYLNATSSGANFGSSAVSASTVSTLDMRNNLFINLSTPTGTGLTVAYRRSSTTLTSYAAASNNNSFYAGTPSATNLIFHDGTNSDQTLAAYKTRVASRDNASLSENPTFVSTTGSSAGFLHIAAATSTLLESGGTTVAGLTTDYDNDARPGPAGSVNGGALAPDIGADEFDGVPVLCSGTPTVGTAAITPASACNPATFNLSLAGASSGPGIIYQWKSATVSGGPYTNIAGATATTYTATGVTTTTYYVMVVTCTASGFSSPASNEVVGTVIATPTVSVTPTTATYCNPGTPVTLTASGGTTYSWSPGTGLNATTGAVVLASPTTTTTYTVTGTTAGCFSSATTTITTAATPTVTATATPNTVCSGGSSQLLATATIPVSSYAVTSIPYAPTVGTGTSPTSGDDAVSGAITLPFSFNFYGTAYTQVFVYTNGFVQLGTSSASSTTYGQLLPSATAPNNIIAGVFSDLNATAGQITTYTTGSSPNRVFTVYYNNVAFYSSSTTYTGNTNFQILLYETTNILEVHVGNVTGASTTTVNKTLGIENSTGALFASPAGHNFLNWTAATAEAWRFTPNTGTYTYGWTPGTFLSATNIANPMATNVTATTSYTVTATSSSGCAANGTVILTSGTVLTSSGTISPASAVCAGTNVTLNSTPAGGGTPYTYSWTGPGGYTSNVQSPVISNITTAQAGAYTLTITDACAATSTLTLTVTVNALPAVNATPASATYCGTTGIAIAATGASTYTWSPAGGLSATTGANVTASPSGGGIISYLVTGTDGNGCVNRDTVVITSSSAPASVTATSSASAVCAGSTVNLSSSAAATETRLSQNFTGGLGTWTVTNAPTSPAVSNWTAQTAPYNFIAGSLSFTNFSTPNGGGFFMSNSDAGGSGTTTNTVLTSPVFSTVGMTSANLSFEHIYQRWASGDITVAVEISTNGGTTWTTLQAYTADQGTVTANAQVATTATISLAAYLNQPNLRLRYNYVAVWGYYWLLDNITVSGASPYTFAWTSTPVGFTSSTQNPTGVLPAATTTYTATVTNMAGCSGSANVLVTVNPTPTVTATSGNSAICTGSSTTLTGSGATTYNWMPGSLTGTTVTVSPTASTTYTVTGTDANGCTSTATVAVIVNPTPTVTATANTSAICNGSSASLTGGGATSYNWMPGNISGSPVTVTPSTNTSYTVTGTDGNGCVNTATVALTVNPNPVVNLGPDASFCGSTTLNAANAGSTYAWSTTESTQTISVNTSATYSVTVTDANGCSAMDAIDVTINPLPVVNLGFDLTQCGGMVTLDAGNPGANYLWSTTDNTQTIMVMTSGTYNVTVADANMCSATDTINVTINTPPTVALGPDITQCAGMATLDAGNAGATYQWSTTGNTQTIMVMTSGIYSVIVVDANMCSGMDTVNVTINALPVVALGSDFTACGSATLDAGNAGSTYAWSTIESTQMITVSLSGTYNVMVTDANNCSNSDTIDVTINTLPVVTLALPMDTICNNFGNFALTGESPAGGTWSGTGVSGSTFDPAVPPTGTYNVFTYTYTDGNGCSGSSVDSMYVDLCIGIATNGTATDVNIYPNPNLGQFTIELGEIPATPVTVEVMNGLGQVVQTFTMTGTTKQVDLGVLEGGVYFVRVTNGENVSLHRVVKQ
jgi:hypothetical protein